MTDKRDEEYVLNIIGEIRAQKKNGDLNRILEIMEAHQDSNRIASFATWSIGRLGGDTEARLTATRLLRDERDDVRIAAANALTKIGDESSVADLLAALHDRHPFVRGWASKALGRIGDRSAVDDLAEQLSDEDWRVRWNAARSLAWIGDARAIGPLQHAARGERTWRAKFRMTRSIGSLRLRSLVQQK